MDTPAQVTNREFAELVATLKLNTKAVEELTHLIRGNGQPGIAVRVDQLEHATDTGSEETIAERVRAAEKEIKEIQNTLNNVARAAWAFVVMFVIFLAGIYWGLTTHAIEIVFK